jgi:hypothetical protein
LKKIQVIEDKFTKLYEKLTELREEKIINARKFQDNGYKEGFHGGIVCGLDHALLVWHAVMNAEEDPEHTLGGTQLCGDYEEWFYQKHGRYPKKKGAL